MIHPIYKPFVSAHTKLILMNLIAQKITNFKENFIFKIP